MAESTLSLTLGDLRRYVCRMMTGDGTYANLSADEQAWVGDCINSGLRMFYTPPPINGIRHQWNFLKCETTLTTQASYTTGTVAVASGVVTLTSGTFPSWAAQGNFDVGGNMYEVSTRDSDTQITLVDTSVTVSSGASYTLSQSEYTLPDNFAYIDSPFYYQPGSATLYAPIQVIGHGQILATRQWSNIVSRPQHASIFATTAGTGGQRWQVRFYPSPDASYILRYRYRIRTDAMSDAADYPVGSMEHAETILAAVLAKTEQFVENASGVNKQDFMERLQASIAVDGESAGHFFGYNGDGSDMHSRNGRLGIDSYTNRVVPDGHSLYQP